MRDGRLFLAGLAGPVIAVVCCVTSGAALLVGTIGLSAAAGYLDVVLLPGLAVFLGLAVYALRRRARARRHEP